MIRVAFGSLPKDSGTYTFYRNQRPALLTRGIDMRCVAVGAQQHALWNDAFADDGCEMIAPDTRSIRKQAQAFVDWCGREEIDIVLGINSLPILSSLPHLPERIRVVARCANAFDHGYRITLSGRERLARIVALSPRLRDDLVNIYDADADILQLIPNGIDPSAFDAAAKRPRGQQSTLRLGFVGRLEHNQKGVLHIPAIVDRLMRDRIPFHLRIAGTGKHEADLRARLANAEDAGRVTFVGQLAPSDIPEFHGETDILLFTSRFEGIPNALLEAMMGGVAPVAFLIDGITDFTIQHDRTGLIAPQADALALAAHISALHADRAKLSAMAQAAAREARARFSAERAADEYADLFRDVMNNPPPPWSPIPWQRFRRDPNFRQSLIELLPAPVGRIVRQAAGRFRRRHPAIQDWRQDMGTAHSGDGHELIYVLGSAYSGSTLLGLALGQYRGVLNLGEVINIEHDWRPTAKCTCGERLAGCAHWQAIKAETDRAVSNGALRLDADTVRHPFDSKGGVWKIAVMLGLPIRWFWSAETRSRYGHKTASLRDAAKQVVPDAEALVDLSKSGERFRVLQEQGLQPVLIYLYRKPHEQFASFLKRPKKSRRLWGPKLLREAFLLRLRLSYHERVFRSVPEARRLRVSFEQFLHDPRATSELILTFCGIDPALRNPIEDARELFVEDQHVFVGNRWLFHREHSPTISIRRQRENSASQASLSRFQHAVMRLAFVGYTGPR